MQLVDTNWINALEVNQTYEARYRYRQTLITATAKDANTVLLAEPHYIPCGQSLVVYKDTECLGGGVVDNTKLQ